MAFYRNPKEFVDKNPEHARHWIALAKWKDAVIEFKDRGVEFGGDWMGGTWVNGTFLGGNWKGGTWINGIWENGRWHDGEWMKGVWKKGEWEGGRWHGGTWKGGNWKGGTWRALGDAPNSRRASEEKTLRKKLIRLAYTNPDLQDKILPLVSPRYASMRRAEDEGEDSGGSKGGK